MIDNVLKVLTLRADDPPRPGYFAELIDKAFPVMSEDDPELSRRARLLVTANVVLFLVSLFFVLVMFFIGAYPLSSILVMFTGCIFTSLNLVFLRLTHSSRLVGAILLLEIMFIISYQAYTDYGLLDPPLLWNLVIPWLAAFFVGPRYGLVFGGLVILVTVGFFSLEMSGYPFPRVSSAEVIWMFYLLSGSSVAFFVGFLGWLYEGHTIGTLRKNNLRLQQAHDALQQSNQRIVGIFESITNGFFALDDKWRFTYVNQKAEQLLNTSRTELIGKNAWEVFSRNLRLEATAAVRQAVIKQKTVEFEVFFCPLERWFEVHVYPYTEGLSVYFSDITERKNYESQLVKAKERAEELAHLKSSILANMSHELRTPLAGILGFAGVLAQETDGEHREFAQLIEESGRRLLHSLNSVMDLTHLDSGNLVAVPKMVNVRDCVDKVIYTHAPLAEERGLQLLVRNEAKNTVIQTDAGFLERILLNLVDNAIKFTEQGSVTVVLSEEKDQLLIEVIDTGVGISETFLPHIFEEFRQESVGLSRSYQGSGLGLAITRRLVDALRGEIEVFSVKDEGTRFTLRFPREQNHAHESISAA